VQKAQETPFLRGEGSRGWRTNFDWFVANHLNVYAVLEGKYDEHGGGNPSDHPLHRAVPRNRPSSTPARRLLSQRRAAIPLIRCEMEL
jgi:hypothetical protein